MEMNKKWIGQSSYLRNQDLHLSSIKEVLFLISLILAVRIKVYKEDL